MSIVKHKDPRSGITYVYESESYWDKEKKQPRSRRTLIGKVDEETGEIVKTNRRGRPRKKPSSDGKPVESIAEELDLLKQKDELIRTLRAEVRKLEAEKRDMVASLKSLSDKWSD